MEDIKMKTIKKVATFLVVTALLAAGGAFALASDGQDIGNDDEVTCPDFILPFEYWET